MLRILICFALLVTLVGCSVQAPKPATSSTSRSNTRSEQPKQQALRLKQPWKETLAIDYLRPAASIQNPELYIYKENRRLYVIDQGVLVRDYVIGLGPEPRGDKMKQGDGRTPEGDFYVCVKNPKSRFRKSLGLSYPTEKHAQRSLFNHIISAQEYRAIILALNRMQPPPWDTPLGGEIFIHGGGAHADWTDGCIALYDSDMDELYTITKVSTPVHIHP